MDAALEAAMEGMPADSPAACTGLKPLGLKASRRSKVMVRPAYSSGASPSSARPWIHRLYNSCVSSGGMMPAKRAVSTASLSVLS